MPKAPAKERFMKLVNQLPDGCWNWIGSKRGDYGMFWMNGAARSAHRVAWEIFKGPITTGLLVCHRCDNGFCVNPEHLFPGTAQDNKDDMVNKDRQRYGVNPPSGSRQWKSCFTEQQVIEIRADARTHAAIAREYGIDPSTISRIKTYKRWTHI